MNLRDTIRQWLGIISMSRDINQIIADLDSGLSDLRIRVNRLAAIVDPAQLPEDNPNRIAESHKLSDYMIKKLEAERKVLEHFGYTPDTDSQ